jgi:hypothetical protein
MSGKVLIGDYYKYKNTEDGFYITEYNDDNKNGGTGVWMFKNNTRGGLAGWHESAFINSDIWTLVKRNGKTICSNGCE